MAHPLAYYPFLSSCLQWKCDAQERRELHLKDSRVGEEVLRILKAIELVHSSSG